MKISLKNRANQRKHLGTHIDEFIQIATRNGYGCRFVYDNTAARPLDRHQLIVHIKDNLVTKIL